MESDYEKKLKDAESRSRITERVKESSNDTAGFYFPFGRE
jgi:putative component of toxin-antitoxin plasmid stabilization module